MEWTRDVGEKNSIFGNQKMITSLIIAFLIGLFLGWTFSGERGEDEATPSVDENGIEEDVEGVIDEMISNEEEDLPQITEGEFLKVLDQEAGERVFVYEVSITEPRWVVIHENLNGEIGNILGARFFSEKESEGWVRLLRNTEPENTYYAALYQVDERMKDRGRVFDMERDLPLIDEEGNRVIVQFNTTEIE